MFTRSRLLGAALTAFGQRSSQRSDLAPQAQPPRAPKPLVIGHRGASGYRPEHTRDAYQLAARQGAVSIEPDLVFTADGHLIARHENELSRSTNVAQLPEFAHRRCTKTVSGQQVTGWFSEDFTLTEVRQLKARERRPKLRAANTYYDGRVGGVLTFAEVLQLASELGIGVHAELKHSHYFQDYGLDMASAVAATLQHANPVGLPAVPVVLMGFEPALLRRLRSEVTVPQVQLIDRRGRPDSARSHVAPRFRDMVTRAGLEQVAEYADAVGLHKDWVLPRSPDGQVSGSPQVVNRAHRAGLEVLAWTVRAENKYLPFGARSSASPAEYGDIAAEINALCSAGVDGILTDHPDLVVNAVIHR